MYVFNTNNNIGGGVREVAEILRQHYEIEELYYRIVIRSFCRREGVIVLQPKDLTKAVLLSIFGDIIYHCHGVPKFNSKWKRFLFFLSLRKCKRIVAVSNHVKNVLENEYKVQSKVLYNPLTVNTISFDEFTSTKKEGVGYIARISNEKGMRDVLELSKRVTIRTVGKFSSKVSEGFKAEFIEATDYVGVLDRGELEEFLSGIKVLIVPSKWGEPFGLVALEALARGCFVLAYADGGLLEIASYFKGTFILTNEENILKDLENLLLKQVTLHDLIKIHRTIKDHFNPVNYVNKLNSLICE